MRSRLLGERRAVVIGLDMYLKASVYVSDWNHCEPDDKAVLYRELATKLNIPTTDESPSAELHFNVAYWRKANAIHNWFVQNVQDGRDECQLSYVSHEQLNQLVEAAKEALALYGTGNKRGAAELLPPTAGFFFGSTEVDDYYREDLVNTVQQLEPLLERKDLEFYYQSSW
jgi:hypothetical protein